MGNYTRPTASPRPTRYGLSRVSHLPRQSRSRCGSRRWDEWKARGITKEKEYAILTNNMTNLELVLNMLAEVTTTSISKSRQPETFGQSRNIAKEEKTRSGLTVRGKVGRWKSLP